MLPPYRKATGFTLVEVLVAVALMAILALMSWRVVDGMARAQALTQDHSDRWNEWQTALTQWKTDLNAITDTAVVPPLDFDGRVLRLTRHDLAGRPVTEPSGIRVVAWSVQPDSTPNGSAYRWARWISAQIRTRGELEQAWQQAEQWGRTPSAALQRQQTVLTRVESWRLFYYRSGAWSNPLSSAGTPEATPTASMRLPDGIRLVLDLPTYAPPAGTLTLDWARPTLSPTPP